MIALGEMVVRELPGWPPRWSRVYGGQLVGFPQGEVGTLRAAAADPEGQAVVLAIECDGDYATGVLPLPPRLIDPIAQRLRACAGMPVRTIGRLEVDGHQA
ncbi:MAG: hypothetical protein ACREMB_14045 [Candidatus Rokuibacteriota bacterium]